MKKLISFIRNYWYYYKVYIIVGVLVLAIVIYSFANKTAEEKFDRCAAVISSAYYTEAQTAALQQALTNEFGSFGVRVYRITLGALNQDDATIAKLDLDLGRKLSDTLLIEDIEAFYEVTAHSVGLSEPVRVSDIPYLAGLGFDELWFAVRN